MSEPDDSSALVRRAQQWTLILGLASALGAGIRWGWRIGAGVGVGVLLSWINFRWLKQGIEGLTGAAGAEADASSSSTKRSAWFSFLGRYVLIAAVLCAILWGLHWPGIAVVGGLFAAVAGTLAALIVHLFQNLRGA